MKKNLRFFLVLVMFVHNNLHSQTISRVSIDAIATYIKNLQFTDPSKSSFGALKKSPNIGAYGTGQYFSIEPYFNHIGAMGILRSDNSSKCQVVKDWLTWWFNHLDAQGRTFNYYYKADGTGETTCPPGATGVYCNEIDAVDSDVALLWGLAYQYYQVSGDLAFFTSTIKTKLELSASYLINNLLQSDGLTWAKPSYQIKYTMDNAEVYWGLSKLSLIEKNIYNDITKSNLYSSKAAIVQTAVQTSLFHSATGLYDNYLGSGNIIPTNWYSPNGITSAVWPQLFEVDSYSSARSAFQRATLNNNFDGSPNTDWTTSAFVGSVDSYTWASIGYIFSMAGDSALGYKQGNYISGIFKAPFPEPPCYIADAGWAIMNMAIKYPPINSCGTVTGINFSDKQSDIEVYPNPFNSNFTLKISPEIIITDAVMKIYDVCGKEVRNVSIGSNETIIDRGDLKNGFYFYSVINNNSTIINGKLLIQ
jgi:hypothetical protein